MKNGSSVAPVKRLVVSLATSEKQRQVINRIMAGAAEVFYLADIDDAGRAAMLGGADMLLTRNPSVELRPGENGLITEIELLQCVSSGVDFIPLQDIPRKIPVAANRGGYSEPIAEHAIAMALAASKSLVSGHEQLRQGRFDQGTESKMLAGGVCGIVGLGGIGVATARLARGIGMSVHALNRSGRSDENGIEWIGSLSDLDTLLAASDVLVLCLPLTLETEQLIGARELGLMKKDAILVNVARGEIIDEPSLLAHLRSTPTFKACIDAWWIEPVRHGRFEVDPAMLALPNLLGSPHNSASVTGWRDEVGLRRALDNCLRICRGEAPVNLVHESERIR